jgi:hypothetical protein
MAVDGKCINKKVHCRLPHPEQWLLVVWPHRASFALNQRKRTSASDTVRTYRAGVHAYWIISKTGYDFLAHFISATDCIRIFTYFFNV